VYIKTKTYFYFSHYFLEALVVPPKLADKVKRSVFASGLFCWLAIRYEKSNLNILYFNPKPVVA
jgi:hypothetical protein